MESNINCYKTELANIVQGLFLDKTVTNIYIESEGNGYYNVKPNVILRLTHICYRCGHGKNGEWVQRGNTMPKRCPHCTSPYWDKPRMSERQGRNDSPMSKERAGDKNKTARKDGKGDGKRTKAKEK